MLPIAIREHRSRPTGGLPEGHWTSVLGALFEPKMGIYIFMIPIPVPGYIFAPLLCKPSIFSHFLTQLGL